MSQLAKYICQYEKLLAYYLIGKHIDALYHSEEVELSTQDSENMPLINFANNQRGNIPRFMVDIENSILGKFLPLNIQNAFKGKPILNQVASVVFNHTDLKGILHIQNYIN